MTQVARIGDFQRLALRRGDELKCVCAYVHIGDCLFDLGHVSRDALAAGAVRGMMCVRFDARRVRPVLSIRPMAG